MKLGRHNLSRARLLPSWCRPAPCCLLGSGWPWAAAARHSVREPAPQAIGQESSGERRAGWSGHSGAPSSSPPSSSAAPRSQPPTTRKPILSQTSSPYSFPRDPRSPTSWRQSTGSGDNLNVDACLRSSSHKVTSKLSSGGWQNLVPAPI